MQRVISLALVAVLAASFLMGRAVHLHAQQSRDTASSLDLVQLHPELYMIVGAGGNIAVNIGREGVVIVDTGTSEMADAVLATIKRLTDQPIRYIINTSADADHVGGNEALAKAGRSLFGGMVLGGVPNNGASVVATDAVAQRMSALVGAQPAYPLAAQPTEAFFTKQKGVYLNEQAIEVKAQPAAHTDGDAIVFFRRSDVVVTGDLVDLTRFPVIDTQRGGSIQGEIAALNRLIELVIPSVPLPWTDGGTQVIPGHGRVAEQAELVEYRDMVTIVRDTVRDLMRKGQTLEQIKTANPTSGYRNRYGTDSGSWTTDMFVEAVYTSLRANAGGAPAASPTP